MDYNMHYVLIVNSLIWLRIVVGDWDWAAMLPRHVSTGAQNGQTVLECSIIIAILLVSYTL